MTRGGILRYWPILRSAARDREVSTTSWLHMENFIVPIQFRQEISSDVRLTYKFATGRPGIIAPATICINWVVKDSTTHTCKKKGRERLHSSHECRYGWLLLFLSIKKLLTVMNAPSSRATIYDHQGRVVCPLKITNKPKNDFRKISTWRI